MTSFHHGQSYLCLPTAASVDGYSSFGASITYQKSKQTFNCPAPVAIVADIDVIAAAPKEMTAAGYADLAAKIPAGAEWMISDFGGSEPIHEDAWHMLQDYIDDFLSDPAGVAAGDPKAIGDIFEGLTLSGFAMQAARSSRPASCCDHLFSHIMDMTGHRYEGKLQSHGFQVAVGTLLDFAAGVSGAPGVMGAADVSGATGAKGVLGAAGVSGLSGVAGVSGVSDYH